MSALANEADTKRKGLPNWLGLLIGYMIAGLIVALVWEGAKTVFALPDYQPAAVEITEGGQ